MSDSGLSIANILRKTFHHFPGGTWRRQQRRSGYSHAKLMAFSLMGVSFLDSMPIHMLKKLFKFFNYLIKKLLLSATDKMKYNSIKFR